MAKKKDWFIEMRVRTMIIALCLLGVAVVGLYQMVFPSAQNEAPQVSGVDEQRLIERGCVLHQTLHYTVCGHSVERKLDAPDTVLGMSCELFEQAMADYRITSFASKRIEMTCAMDMACPAHWVICADADGVLGIYRNLYGEEMLCLRKLNAGVSAAPESDWTQLRRGMCFDSAQEAEAYLEAIQS